MNIVESHRPPPQQPPQEHEEDAAIERMERALHLYGREITAEMERFLRKIWYCANLILFISIIFQSQILFITKTTLSSQTAKCFCSTFNSISPFTAPLMLLGLFVDAYHYLRDSVLPTLRDYISDYVFPPLLPRLDLPSSDLLVIYMILFMFVSLFVYLGMMYVCSDV